MSKEKTLRTLEETEVMQAAGVPAQEGDGAEYKASFFGKSQVETI